MRVVRNFAIIAHIDHGKSTLADRLMEVTGILPPLVEPSSRPASPRIDRMELETERGVTIKLKAVRIELAAQQIANSKWQIVPNHKPYAISHTPVQNFVLNMIDTPGHVDFSYEVSRSLAACEGALLLVDATQGVQAQTLSHLEEARKLGLVVIGAVNKVDSPLARVGETERELRQLGVGGDILRISALEGIGIDEVLAAITERVPAPRGELAKPFRALVFDSSFDPHLGVLAYVRVVDGEIKIRDQSFDKLRIDPERSRTGQKSKIKTKVKFLGTGAGSEVKELGFFNPDRKLVAVLSAGEIGYIATGLPNPQDVRVGDTVIKSSDSPILQSRSLPGYQPPQSFVFASFFSKNLEFELFQKALRTLRLEEPAISIEEISSIAFGRGFRIGFLGTFHLEIVKERLEREFGLELVVTKPTVNFKRESENQRIGESERPDHPIIQSSGSPNMEPWILLTVLTPPEYLSGLARLAAERRGRLGETETLGNRLKILVELPLLEFVRGFYDALKSTSRGYASLSWEFSGYRPAELVELKILVHGESVEGLTEIVLREEAVRIGREKIKKLKEILPRQQFAYAIQAKVGGKVIAREDVSATSKDVLAKLSGGHVERKMKKLEEQRKGKKKLARLGRGKVDLPPEAFLV